MDFKRHRKLLDSNGSEIDIDEKQIFFRDINGNLTLWDGKSILEPNSIIINGTERYSRIESTETTAQDMITDRNLTVISNKINDIYTLNNIVQGTWVVGAEATNVFSPTLQLADINSNNFTSSQRVRIKLSASLTDENITPTKLFRVVTDTTTTRINPTIFTGKGLNDIKVTGDYTGTTVTNFVIAIDSVGITNDTFKWSTDGGVTFPNTGAAVSTSPILLQDGISVAFGSATGHTIGEQWKFTADRDVDEIIVDSNGTGLVSLKLTDVNGASNTSVYLHMTKSHVDLNNNLVLRAVATFTFDAVA